MKMEKLNWWNPVFNDLATELTPGILAEMKTRVENTHIQKQKLQLSEETPRMKEFFEREVRRYHKRKAPKAEVKLETKAQSLSLEEQNVMLRKQLMDEEAQRDIMYETAIKLLEDRVANQITSQ